MSCLVDDWVFFKWWVDIWFEVFKVVNVCLLIFGVDGRWCIGIRLWVVGVVVVILGCDDFGFGVVELGIKGGMVWWYKCRISIWFGVKWVVLLVGGCVECVKEN